MTALVTSTPAETLEPQNGDILLVGGIPTSRINRSEMAALMVADSRAAAAGSLTVPKVVVYSNGAVVAAFHRDPKFRDLMLAADLIDADGMPLILATRLLCRRPLSERVAITDFIHDAAQHAVAAGLKFYFLGAAPGVADVAAEHFRREYPGLQIVGSRHGYFSTADEAAICKEIVQAGTDILWVGLGSPLQEAFAQRNKHRLGGLAWIHTCGGLFDHYSGRFKRAPMWMQQYGLEWLHRMMAEPFRLGPRYLSTNLQAAYHLLTHTSDAINDVKRR